MFHLSTACCHPSQRDVIIIIWQADLQLKSNLSTIYSPPPPTTEKRVTCHWELFSGKGVLNSYSHHPFLNGMNSLARTTSRAERNMKPGIAENVVAAHSSIFMTFILIHSAEEFNLTDFSRCTDEI